MGDLDLIVAIKSEISESLKRNVSIKYEDTVNLFIDFMRLPISDNETELEGCPRIINALNKFLVEGVEKENKDTFIAECTKVEPFLRKILYFSDNAEYLKLDLRSDGLIPLINSLALNPRNINLNSDPRNFDTNPLYIDHFIKIYRNRNSDSHKLKIYSSKETGQIIESSLMIYIYVCDKFKHVIRKALSDYTEIVLPVFNEYCESIITSIKERIGRVIHLHSKENITLSSTYVSEFVTKSVEDRDIPFREGTIDELRRTKVKENRMIIWGDAGMGKTTTLEYLTYKDAIEYKRNNENSIPVLLSLGVLTELKTPLKQYIYTKLGVDSKIGDILIEKGKINLFLDGLNEIPYDEKSLLRTYRQKEIEGLVNGNKNLFIIISNRPHEVNIYNNVPVFIIQKMNNIQIYEFINKYMAGLNDLALYLKKELDTNERLMEIVRTPLMLSMLIEILKSEGTIPRNEGKIIGKFIKSIYKREKIEKKDANFNQQAIHRLLSFLACYCLENKGTNSGLTENEVYGQFLKCTKDFGFSIDLSYAVDILVQLNILEIREGLYSFSHHSYLEYFYAEYERIIFEQ